MIIVDEQEFPIVIVRFIGTHSDAEFAGYLRQLDAMMARYEGQEYGCIMDSREARMPTAKQARMQAEWMKQNTEEMQSRSAGLVFVLPTAAMRGALRAILWLAPIPIPYAVVETLEQARTWMRAQLGVEPAVSA